MIEVLQSDPRFTHITGCSIIGLYKRIPHMFGGYVMEIRYKKYDKDFLSEHKYIHFDQNKLLSDIIKLINGDVDRIYFTFGMGDIEIFKRNKEYVIYWSRNDGMYHYYFFSEEEFKNLKTWIELENSKK